MADAAAEEAAATAEETGGAGAKVPGYTIGVMGWRVRGVVGAAVKTEDGTMMVVAKPLIVTGTISPPGGALAVPACGGEDAAGSVSVTKAAGWVIVTVSPGPDPIVAVTTAAGSVTKTVVVIVAGGAGSAMAVGWPLTVREYVTRD